MSAIKQDKTTSEISETLAHAHAVLILSELPPQLKKEILSRGGEHSPSVIPVAGGLLLLFGTHEKCRAWQDAVDGLLGSARIPSISFRMVEPILGVCDRQTAEQFSRLGLAAYLVSDE